MGSNFIWYQYATELYNLEFKNDNFFLEYNILHFQTDQSPYGFEKGTNAKMNIKYLFITINPISGEVENIH